MDFPSKLRYTKDHEWINLTENPASVGITEYALEQLGDVVHLELPKVGSVLEKGDPFGSVESTKTVSDLYMPVSGKIVEINDSVIDQLESIGEDPYDGGWLIKVQVSESDPSLLLSDAQYSEFIAES